MYRAILVDDEPIALEGLLSTVKWADHRFAVPFTASGVSEAKQLFTRDIIDVMICDIEMPQQNGIELLEWVRANYPRCVCIFLTSHDEFKYAQQAIRLGVLDYLLKPISEDQLKNTLEKAILQLNAQEAARRGTSYLESAADVTASQVEDPENQNVLIENVKSYIDTHISTEISREQIAAHVFLSSDHVARVFRKKVGQSLGGYIQNKRIDIASELLAGTNLPISKVAISVGYTHMGHFSSTFKKTTGLAPQQYRLKYKK